MNATGGLKPRGGGFQQQHLAQARVYSLTPRSAKVEEEEYVDVATSTIPLFGSLTSILFDSDAM